MQSYKPTIDPETNTLLEKLSEQERRSKIEILRFAVEAYAKKRLKVKVHG